MRSMCQLHKKFYLGNQRCTLHKFTFCQIKFWVWKVIYSLHVWWLVLPISTLSRSILGVYFTVSTYSCFLWGLGLVSREFEPRKKDKTPDPCFLPIDWFENVEDAKVRYTSHWKPIIYMNTAKYRINATYTCSRHSPALAVWLFSQLCRRYIYERQTFLYLNFISMKKTKSL